MDRRAFAFSFALTTLALAGLAPKSHAATTPAAAFSPEEKSAVTRSLEQAVRRGDTPGVVALIVNADGVVYEAAVGRADASGDAPMATNAIFYIASMTKPVTSVAIMMLLEQGRLSLDDPVSKHLSGFDNLQVITHFNEADGTYETRPAARAMTVRHLLTHTSGIGYAFTSPILARLQQDTNRLEWEFPLLHDPGGKWTYGAGTRVLGLIVEKITGVPLETYYQQHIFQPLGMRDTSFAVPPEKQSRVPPLHQRVDGALQVQAGRALPATPPVPSRGDGGLYSTARDYGLFVRMLLNGGRLGSARILSARSVELMGRNQIGPVYVSRQQIGVPALSKPFPLGAGRDKFGLGFQITAGREDGRAYRSPGSLSWAGLYNTEFWIDPREKLGGVLLMQTLPFYDDGAIRTLREFEAAVYRAARRTQGTR